jgi:hypothetical protein
MFTNTLVPIETSSKVAAGPLALLAVASTYLLDHELIDYQESNPQRVPHIHSQDGDPPSHEL